MGRRFERLHPVEHAVDLVARVVSRHVRVEDVSVYEAVGRIAAREYRARLDLPPVDKSVLDGYALRSSDVAGASQANPAVLRVAGEIRVDEESPPALGVGEAYRVPTGAPIPRGADVVVPLEAVREEDGLLYVYKPYAPGYGVMRRGEDFEKGELIVKRGERITWGHVGVLAAQGYGSVRAYRFPRIAVFSVGDEVVEPGEHLPPGKVYNSSRPLVEAFLVSRGFQVVDLGHVPDEPRLVERKFLEGLERADIVAAIGGSSVGGRDYTAEVLKKLSDEHIHGLLLRPGRPAAVGRRGDKLLLSLSGFPVAAWTQVYTVLEQGVYRAAGIEWPPDPLVEGVLERSIASPAGVLDVVRVHVCARGGSIRVKPLRVTGSGVLSTLTRGNAVLLIGPDSTGYREGSLAPARLLYGEIPACRDGDEDEA